MFLELCLSLFPFTEWINEIILKLAIYRHSLKREHDLGKIIQACLCSPRNTPLAPLKGNLVPSGGVFSCAERSWEARGGAVVSSSRNVR